MKTTLLAVGLALIMSGCATTMTTSTGPELNASVDTSTHASIPSSNCVQQTNAEFNIPADGHPTADQQNAWESKFNVCFSNWVAYNRTTTTVTTTDTQPSVGSFLLGVFAGAVVDALTEPTYHPYHVWGFHHR